MKCHNIIHRFSEDIDLTIQCDRKPGGNVRKILKANIMDAAEVLGLTITNLNQIKSRMDFNRYLIDYNATLSETYLYSQLIVETAVVFSVYSTDKLKASSYIAGYLEITGQQETIHKYRLEPFELFVQSLSRTLLDKIFALGDYYLSNRIEGKSRHIYDIYRLLDKVPLDDNLRNLEELVRAERKTHGTCLSAGDSINMKELLSTIVTKEAYKDDYISRTQPMLYDAVDYDTAITAIQRLIEDYYVNLGYVQNKYLAETTNIF